MVLAIFSQNRNTWYTWQSFLVRFPDSEKTYGYFFAPVARVNRTAGTAVHQLYSWRQQNLHSKTEIENCLIDLRRFTNTRTHSSAALNNSRCQTRHLFSRKFQVFTETVNKDKFTPTNGKHTNSTCGISSNVRAHLANTAGATGLSSTSNVKDQFWTTNMFIWLSQSCFVEKQFCSRSHQRRKKNVHLSQTHQARLKHSKGTVDQIAKLRGECGKTWQVFGLLSLSAICKHS